MLVFEKLGGDVVVKPLFGSEGHGIERLRNSGSAQKLFSTIELTGGVLYLQEFVPHAGWDLRVFVIDNQVIAAMKRYAADGWRSNIALGGRAEAVTLKPEEEKLALDAARAVGCPIAGVDLLPGKDGMYVIEVNAVPGWQALSAVSGVDVAWAIIDKLVRWTIEDTARL
jgi:ribosomal protein S6--L-glutamate ligase